MRFGRTAKAASGRHRTAPGEPQGADLTPDHEIESYLDAISPLRDPEVTDPGRRFGDAKVYQLRLPSGAEEQVQWLAEQHGTSPLRMLQGWVLQRLHHEFGRPAGAPPGRSAGAERGARCEQGTDGRTGLPTVQQLDR